MISPGILVEDYLRCYVLRVNEHILNVIAVHPIREDTEEVNDRFYLNRRLVPANHYSHLYMLLFQRELRIVQLHGIRKRCVDTTLKGHIKHVYPLVVLTEAEELLLYSSEALYDIVALGYSHHRVYLRINVKCYLAKDLLLFGYLAMNHNHHLRLEPPLLKHKGNADQLRTLLL